MNVRPPFVTIFILGLMLIPCRALPQSKEDAVRLWNEAWNIETSAKTKQDREKAARLYEQVLSSFEKLGDKEKVWAVATNLGKVNSDLGQYATARDYYQKAMDVAKTAASVEGQAQGLNGLGCVHWELGQFDKAIQYFQQALEAYKKAGNTEWEAITFNHIGEVHREQGQYSRATEHYQKALDISRRIASLEGEADALHNLGEVSRLQGQYSKAMDYYSKSLNMYRQIRDFRLQGITLSDMGTVYSDWGRHDEAINHYHQAMEIFRQGGIIREEARTTLEIGRIHQSLGEHKEALAAFQKGLDLYKELGVDTGGPLKLIADLYLDMKQPDKADTFVKQSNSPVVSGRYHLMKGEHEEAKSDYTKLLQSAEASGNAEELFTAHTGLGRTYESLEDYKNAEKHYARAMEMTEEIRASLLPAERKRFFNVRINGFYRSEPAKGLTRVKMKLNELGQSIVLSELTRARAFADRLAQGSGNEYGGVPVEILAQEQTLHNRIAGLRKARNKTPKGQNPQRYEELSHDISKAEAELTSLVDMLRKNHPAYAAMKYSRPVELRESALRPEEFVVIFDVSQDEVHVKLVKGKKIRSQFSADWSAEALKADVERFREALRPDKLGDFDPELGHRLYTDLLMPVLSKVPVGTPIIIMPDGILSALPFEALVTSGKDSWKKDARGEYTGLKYLGDVYPISYHQSITVLTLARNQKKPVPQKDKALVLADPVFGNNDERLNQATASEQKRVWRSLPADIMSGVCLDTLRFRRLKLTDQLAQTIKELYPGKADVYVGMDANKTVVMKRPLQKYGSIVFATQGYYDEESSCVGEPILALAGADQGASVDGLLKMTEVTGLDLNADLVALTACQTALGKQVTGEGTMGMGWAFQWAGARSVLMTLWAVDERASVNLVSAFFKHLKAGKSKLESLNLARADIRKSGFEHPYYWAGFILLGEIQ